MKSREHFFALLGFNLQFLPRFMLPMLVIFSLSASMHGILAIVFRAQPEIGEMSSLLTALNVMPIMFCSILGLQFFIRETGWAGTADGWLMPAGEFLFSRPVPRRAAYFSRMSLYFMILLLPPLLNVGLTTVEPELRISLYHNRTRGPEILNRYQEQFPNSVLIRAPQLSHDTLKIPFGRVLVAFWQLWLVILLALVLQAATLLTLPSKLQLALFMVIGLAPMFVISFGVLGDPTKILENVFFFFARHWGLTALFTLGAFALVQRMALQRIQHMEFI